MKTRLNDGTGQDSLAASINDFLRTNLTRPIFLLAMLLGVLALPAIVFLTVEAADKFSFRQNYLTPIHEAKWVREGDMDLDGDLDLTAGGNRSLVIFENDGSGGGWTRYGNLGGNNGPAGNGGVVSDVDGDGDLDVVGARNYNDAGWWENPGGALRTVEWEWHLIEDQNWLLHDMILADLDNDGKAEEYLATYFDNYWNANIHVTWYRPGSDPTKPWEKHAIEPGRNEGTLHGHSGIDTGDIDKDGNLDVGFSNGWYEAPDNPSGNWVWHEVANIYGISNTQLDDVDGDNDLDLVISSGHHGQGAFWMENDGSPKNGAWPQHNISVVTGDLTKRHKYDGSRPDLLHHPECLDLADLDSDGDLDVITCDIFFGQDAGEPEWGEEVTNLYVFENLGDSLSWTRHNVAPNSHPNHLLKVVDVNEDGKLDIISDGARYPNVNFYENIGSGGSTPPTKTPVPPTNTPVPPTSTPVPGNDGDVIYLSSSSGGIVGSVTFADEDIIALDRDSDIWSMLFDGSDVGLGSNSSLDINAFDILDDGSILFSVFGDASIPDVGAVDDSDIIKFVPTSLGVNTAGSFSLYFDGSDVGLTALADDIDALTVLPGGDLLVSTLGSSNAGGLGAKDEDLLRFSPTRLGANTSGSWLLYFDGSDVGLNESPSEEVWGVTVDGSDGVIYLTTKDRFTVSGLSGDGSDIIQCLPTSLGDNTSCSFQMEWDGSDSDFAGEIVDGMVLRKAETGGGIPPTSTPVPPTPTSVPGTGDWADQDIGPVGIPGSTSYGAGTITVVGSGKDIWGVADEFHYAYQPLAGDGEIIARVVSQTNSNSWAKAGLMIRESMAANAKHATAMVTIANGTRLQWRATTGGSTSDLTRGTDGAPIWLRIVRTGDQFDAYLSNDGVNWGTPYRSATVSMAQNALIGLAVTSHTNARTSEVVFSNVQVID